MSNQPSTSNTDYQRLQWSDDSSDDDDHNRERLCTTPIDGIPQEMSNQPSTSAAYYRDNRWNQSSDDELYDNDPGIVATSRKEITTKTKSGFNPSAPGEESDGNSSDNDEIVTKRRPPIRRISEKKRRSQLQVRSKGGQFVKKSMPNASRDDSPIRQDNESEEEEEEEEEMEPPKKKKVKVEKKPRAMTDEQVKKRNRQRNLQKKKKEQWDAAVKAQAARDAERTSSAKRKRPLNRYIQSRPPPPEPDSDEEPTVPPPPPTKEELAARLAVKQERHRLYEEKKAKREEELARKREVERNRRFFPSKNPKRGGTFEGCPSTRTTDRSGNPSTSWEDWKKVIYVDEEKMRKVYKNRTKKQIHQLKPRTGPAANNGVYAIESRRQLEKDSEQKGFQYVAKRHRKKEESDPEEEIDDDCPKEPKNRLHSAATRAILKEAFKNAQYLSEDSAKKLVRATKLSLQQVKAWFQNTRNKTWSQFRKGKIAELPEQMKVMDGMNKEREERGEHLKMRDPVEESDEEDDGPEDSESSEEESEDSDDTESEEDEDEEDEGVRQVAVRNLEWLSTVGYPVFPGEKPYRRTQGL